MNNTTEHTSVVIRANLAKAETALKEFEKIESGLADLRSKYEGVVFAVGTPKGMREAVAARAEIREPRYKTEHARKAGKAPIIALGKNIEGRAAYITEELLKIENPIHEQIAAREKVLADEKAERDRVEAERVAKIKARIQDIGGDAVKALGKSAIVIQAMLAEVEDIDIDESFAEFKEEAMQAKKATAVRLAQLHADAVQAETDRAELAKLRAEKEQREREQNAAVPSLPKNIEELADKIGFSAEHKEKIARFIEFGAPERASAVTVIDPTIGAIGPGHIIIEGTRTTEEGRAALLAFKNTYWDIPEFATVNLAIRHYFEKNP